MVFASTRKVTPSYWLYTSNKGDPKNSKVTAGHVVMFAGGPISWQCKQALHVGASPSHNEYMEAFHAAKEAKWLRDLLIELDIKEFPSDVPVVLETMTSWTIHGMVTTGNSQECVRDALLTRDVSILC